VLKETGAKRDLGIVAQSIDLNLGGIYCKLTKHLELFSKLQIELALPIQDATHGIVPVSVNTTAVVVRVEPEQPDPNCGDYDCALAFVGLSPEAELALARFMLQSIARSPN
jgi:hypothetical protein